MTCNQGAESQEILHPEECPAGRDDDERILCSEVGPVGRNTLQAAIVVVEVGTKPAGRPNAVVDEVELMPEEGVERVGHAEATV